MLVIDNVFDTKFHTYNQNFHLGEHFKKYKKVNNNKYIFINEKDDKKLVVKSNYNISLIDSYFSKDYMHMEKNIGINIKNISDNTQFVTEFKFNDTYDVNNFK